MASHVRRELLDGSIPILRFRFERLERDSVEIATQPAPKLIRRRSAR
jgi:hypothetical protein